MDDVQQELRSFSYKKLQAIAKTKQVRANRKKEDLIQLIIQRLDENQELEDFLKKMIREKELAACQAKQGLKRDRRYANNNYEYSRDDYNGQAASPWTNHSYSSPARTRQKSPLYTQFVTSEVLPSLTSDDLIEINDGYVPNGHFIPQKQQRTQCYHNYSRNEVQQSQLLNIYHRTESNQHQYYTSFNRQELHDNYLPRQSWESHYYGLNNGFEINYNFRSNNALPVLRGMPSVQHRRYNPYTLPKALANHPLSLDLAHQWSDPMISAGDPLLGSSSSIAISEPNKITEEKASDRFELDYGHKTNNFDVMNFIYDRI